MLEDLQKYYEENKVNGFWERLTAILKDQGRKPILPKTTNEPKNTQVEYDNSSFLFL